MSNSRQHHSIPADAELVFDGVRAKIFQWNQTMYDGSVARFERTRFADGAFVLPILKNGNILLTRQEQPARKPFISLPGGGIEENEDSIIAAKRELLEEAGAISLDWKHWLTFDGTTNVATFVDYFIARNCEIIQEIQPDSGEKISLFEVSFDEFLELSSDENFHHHWNLLPILYEARLKKEKYEELKEFLYGK